MEAATQERTRATRPESPVRVCFTGRNRAGSWTVRGEQMATCRRNWHGAQELTGKDYEAFDVYCVVKRPDPPLHERLLRAGKVVVFDVVDSWAQPADNARVRNAVEARALFADKWRGIPKFHAHIFANRAMYQDLMPLAARSTYIYHHANPAFSPHPPRPAAQTVGYEGNENYLGPWRDVIEDICRRKGLRFVVNPTDFRDIDIGFATRGGEHTGYLPNTYKSNVKLANFYATGTPCLVGSTEVSYHETDCGEVRFFADPRQLERQLEGLLSFETRRSIHERFVAAARAFRIEHIAAIYEHCFTELLRRMRR